MRSRHVNGIITSLAASALMGLFLTSVQVKADTQQVQQPVAQTTQQNADSTKQSSTTVYTESSKEVPVVSYTDHQSKPNNDYWSNPAKYKDAIPVQILGINDVHGNIDTTGKTWIGYRSYQNAGNAARLAGYLNNAESDFKKKNPNGTTIRVEAGDIVGASPATSSLLQDEPTMHALKQMHIEIGTLGNHEFDEGLDEFDRVLEGKAPKKGQFNQEEQDYPHENSSIQIVVSNLVRKSDGKVPFGWKPYIIKELEYNGKKSKIGFIGIDTTDLPKLTFAKNLKDYEVLDEAESIAKYDKILQDQGVHAIVVLAHTGVETYKGQTQGDAVKILQKLYRIDPDNSVDLYIAAHSHQYANGGVGNTKLVQAASFSKAYDDAIGYIDPSTNDFVKGSLITHVYPVMSATDDKEIQPDPAVEQVIKDAEQRTSKITNSVIGKAAAAKDITKDLNSDTENAIGDLVVDAQMAEAKREGIVADIAITNGGGVRSDLKVEKDGSIKWQSAQSVQPFSNQIQVFEVTGKQLYDLLNSQYDSSNESRYYLLSGMHYVYTTQNDKAFPKKVAVLYDGNNHPVDPNKVYRVITSNYLVDSTSQLKGAKKVADIGVDTDIFVNYLKHQTEEGNLITAPILSRKKAVTPEEAKQLIKEAQDELNKMSHSSSEDNEELNNSIDSINTNSNNTSANNQVN
ncbi:Endonuclease YhcR [Lactobacillus helveticus]|nr:bifunctional metallophosphatase/5'-nucleotidase [Lactobacillus helveticus]NRO56711.1 Endonuclease YhcR [Lactobacillus helveticus]